MHRNPLPTAGDKFMKNNTNGTAVVGLMEKLR
jgi:hypothetical protein